jgi:hypothetical protein
LSTPASDVPVAHVVALSAEQRRALFEQTGVHVFRLVVDRASGTARPIDRGCRRCLLNDALPGVTILRSGLCNHCAGFQVEADAGAYDEERVRGLVDELRGRGNPDCVLAYSGGKDSAAALMVAVDEYGLRPLAVLADNGFIPAEVVEASTHFCAQFGVSLVARTFPLARIAAAGLRHRRPAIPCRSCMRSVFALIADEARARGTRLVIAGYRFPPLAFPVSAFTRRREDEDVVCVAPLLAAGTPEAEQLGRLEQAGWRRMRIAGNTSNCRLIGYVEEVFYDRVGYNPHVFEVSSEIRAGFYSREAGMRKLERPALTPAHRAEVVAKLESTP